MCARVHVHARTHSVVSDSVTPCPVAHWAPLSMGILQARILEWVAMPSSKGIFPTQGSNPHFLRLPAFAERFFITEPPGKPGGDHNGYQSLSAHMPEARHDALYAWSHLLCVMVLGGQVLPGSVFARWEIRGSKRSEYLLRVTVLTGIWVRLCFLPEPELPAPLQGCLLYEKPPAASLAWPLPGDQRDGRRAPLADPASVFWVH